MAGTGNISPALPTLLFQFDSTEAGTDPINFTTTRPFQVVDVFGTTNALENAGTLTLSKAGTTVAVLTADASSAVDEVVRANTLESTAATRFFDAGDQLRFVQSATLQLTAWVQVIPTPIPS